MAVELPESGIWDVVVSVDGADVSDRLTGRLRIEAEEGAARIAEFTLLPTGGQLALTDWVGAPAVIDVIQDGSAHRLFTGLVDHPRYDPATRQVTLICTDARQEKLDALDAASIEALTPGALWSPDVFDGDADGLRRAEDRLSTLPAVLDLGLDAAVEWQGHEFQTRTGIPCDVRILTADAPPPDVSATIFRILQEALTNATRHSGAS